MKLKGLFYNRIIILRMSHSSHSTFFRLFPIPLPSILVRHLRNVCSWLRRGRGVRDWDRSVQTPQCFLRAGEWYFHVRKCIKECGPL